MGQPRGGQRLNRGVGWSCSRRCASGCRSLSVNSSVLSFFAYRISANPRLSDELPESGPSELRLIFSLVSIRPSRPDGIQKWLGHERTTGFGSGCHASEWRTWAQCRRNAVSRGEVPPSCDAADVRSGWNPALPGARLGALALPLGTFAVAICNSSFTSIPACRNASEAAGRGDFGHLPSRSRRFTTACLPTCDVRGRDPQRALNVGRVRRNNTPTPMPARGWMQAQATRHPAV